MKKRTLPYGYIIRNGEIIIDRNAEKIITEIFQAYLDGMSFGKIADEMTVPVTYFSSKCHSYADIVPESKKNAIADAKHQENLRAMTHGIVIPGKENVPEGKEDDQYATEPEEI
jgi:hypothetical protein